MSDRSGAADRPDEGPLGGEEGDFRKTALGDSLYAEAENRSRQKEEAGKNLMRQVQESRGTLEDKLRVAEARERCYLASTACHDVQLEIAVWRGDGEQVAVKAFHAAEAREIVADVRIEIARLKLVYPSLRGEKDAEDPE